MTLLAPLSPLEALGPAFRRTREVLARPFRLGFFLKIALIAALTQPSFYSASISYPAQGIQFAVMSRMPHRGVYGLLSGAGFATAGLAIMLIFLLVGVVAWVLISYLYCRLRFTLFDLVVYKRGRVGQAWSRYGRQSWRYFGLTILASLAFLVAAVVIAGLPLLHFVHAMRGSDPASIAANPFRVIGAMLPFLGALLLVGLLWAIVDALMQDFLLPPMALEDASLEQAFQRLFALLHESFGPVALYLLLRFAIAFGITWILLMAMFVVLLAGGLGVFAVGIVLYHTLWTSMTGQVTLVALAIVMGLIFLALYFFAMISIYGIAAVFKQSYAAYFFGGHYPELGSKLEAQTENSAEELPQPPPRLPPSLPSLGDVPPVW